MRDESKIMIVAKGIRLNPADRFFLEAGRQGIVTKDEFIGSFGILDARPDVIAFVKADGGFQQIAVED